MLKYIISGIFFLLIFTGCSSKTYMSDGRNNVIVKKTNSSTTTGTLNAPNGTYVGSIMNGAAHGYGKYTWNDGSKYEGYYRYGRKSGEGKFTWIDGTIYEGGFYKGKRNGNGTQYKDDSYKIKGYFNGSRCQNCSYSSKNMNPQVSSIYATFELSDSFITPINASLTYTNKEEYNGEVNNYFEPEGKGTMLVKDGTEKIVGQWTDGELTSVTSRTKTNKYFALMKENEKCKLYLSGWIYTGDNCRNNLASGYGEAVGFDGESKFIGTFENGTFKNGTYTKGDKKIEGDFQNGKVHGKAIIYDNNQIVYEGYYRNGSKHGEGVCLHNGEYEKCEYFQDKRVDTLYKQRLARAELDRREQELAKKERELAKKRRATRNYSNTRTNSRQNSTAGAGSTVVDTVADCAKGYIAKKACERLPWPANNICMATARSNYPCLNMLGK